MADKITARLQTPKDSEGKRKDIHLITTAEEVIVHPESEEPQVLEEYLSEVDEKIDHAGDGIFGYGDDQPETEKQALWLRPVPENQVPSGDYHVIPVDSSYPEYEPSPEPEPEPEEP